MGAKKRRTPQEKKRLSYERDYRDHYYDSPNVKFSRKLNPLRNAQENRRRRRVFNARTAELAAMDEDEVDADVEAGELEQDLGRLGKRGASSYGPFSLRQHVDRIDAEPERRRVNNAAWMWAVCRTCGRRHRIHLGDDPDIRAALEAGASAAGAAELAVALGHSVEPSAPAHAVAGD